MAKQRRTSLETDAGETAQEQTPQEKMYRAASAGMSITSDTSKEIGTFLTKAIEGLQKNLEEVLTLNNGTDPLGQCVLDITGTMIEVLTKRANAVSGVVDPAAGGAAKKSTRKRAAAGRKSPRRDKVTPSP